MGDSINVDFGAGANMNPQGPLGVVNQSYAGAEEGYKLGQVGAMIHALQGIDLNNPVSVDQGIGNLVRANALEQGGALQNLAFTRSLRQMIPGLLASLAGSPQSGVTDTTGTTSPTGATPQADPQHALDTMTQAKGAVDGLLHLPADQRPAAFQIIKQQFLQRGVPEPAIDAAGADLSDEGLSKLSAYYGDTIAHMGHQISPTPGAEAPTVPAPHPSNAWYLNAVQSPQIPLAIGMLKGAGFDLTPYLTTAERLAQPFLAKQAESQYAGQIAQATAGAQKSIEAAFAPYFAGIDVAKAVQTEKGTLPYKIALENGVQDIRAAHDTIQIPEIGKDGQPTGRMLTYRKDVALQKGANGEPMGKTQSPGEQSGQEADSKAFMDRYAEEANQGAIQADLAARDQARATAHLAQTLNPSNLTPWVSKNVNTLNGLGFHIAAKDANDLAAYQQGLAQNLKNATTVFPRLTNEFHVVGDAVANARTPGDAAALSLTTTAVLRDMAAKEKEFRIEYAEDHPGEYSERAFQEAWARQPGANQSPFAHPFFRDLKFNGKPAVAIAPPFTSGPHAGEQWGVFMPGTPQKTAFRVR